MYVEIQADEWRFQPRVAAVFVWQGHVLLQGSLDDALWVLPGGRLLPLEHRLGDLGRVGQMADPSLEDLDPGFAEPVLDLTLEGFRHLGWMAAE